MAMVDSEFGRYDSEARRVLLFGGGWHCAVCNSTKYKRISREAGEPLCDVCQDRWRLDLRLADGEPAARLHAEIARKRWPRAKRFDGV